MKKYVVSIKTENAVQAVNDYIIINSLFSVGETITDPVLKLGENYTDDERIYQAVCAFINEGGKDTEAFNLCAFDAKFPRYRVYKDENGKTQIERFAPAVYHVSMKDEEITVNGYTFKLKIKYSLSAYFCSVRKTFMYVSAPERLAFLLQENFWRDRAEAICKHVLQYGKRGVL